MFLPINLGQLVKGSTATPDAAASPSEEDPGRFGLCPREVAHLGDFGKASVVDIRNAADFSRRHIAGALHQPRERFDAAPLPGDPDLRVVLCCDTGERSRRLAFDLRCAGQRRVTYLLGGLDAWAGEGLSLVGTSEGSD